MKSTRPQFRRMHQTSRRILLASIAAALSVSAAAIAFSPVPAGVPGLLNYQGKITVGTAPFNGSGSFKFALVSGKDGATLWSNDGTSVNGGEPAAAVSLTVAKGLYAVQLGDAALPNMNPIPAAVFSNPDVRLRVWFNDGVNGFEQITPDQRIAAVGYAMTAANVADGAITVDKLAKGAVTSDKIAPGAIGSAQLGSDLTLSGTVTGGKFVGDGSGLTNLPSGGGLTWSAVTTATQTASANNGYIADSLSPVVFTLPTDAALGATVRVTGINKGGFKVVAGANQTLLKGVAGNGASLTWDSHAMNTSSAGTSYFQTINSSLDVSADAVKIVAVSSGNGSFRSEDGGATWAYSPAYSGSGGITGAKSAAADLSSIYYAYSVYNGVQSWSLLKTTDLGKTWTAGNLRANEYPYYLTGTGDNKTLYAVVYSYSNSTYKVIRSSDSGATWTDCAPPSGAGNSYNPNNLLAVSKTDGAVLLASAALSSDNRTHFFRSADSGATWTDLKLPPPPSSSYYNGTPIVSDDLSVIAWVVTNSSSPIYQNSITISRDGGATWSTVSAGAPATQNYGSLQLLSMSRDGSALAGYIQAYNNSINTYEYSVRASTDGGLTWSSSPSPVMTNNEFVGAFRVAPSSGAVFWASSSGNFSVAPMNTTGNYTLTGSRWSSVEVQYLGNGLWAPITVSGAVKAE